MSRRFIATLIAGLFLMGSGAGAAGTTSFRDISNDANGVNGQEHGGGNGIATGAASIDAATSGASPCPGSMTETETLKRSG